jgi:predicted nucleic acid-binding protein
MYLLDTDVVIDVLAGERRIEGLLVNLASSGVSMSSITLMEVTHGIMLRGTDWTADRFEQLQQQVLVIPFASREALECAAIRASLQRAGKRVRPRALDLMIAATALLHGLILLTWNTNDYQDVPGLLVRMPVEKDG